MTGALLIGYWEPVNSAFFIFTRHFGTRTIRANRNGRRHKSGDKEAMETAVVDTPVTTPDASTSTAAPAIQESAPSTPVTPPRPITAKEAFAKVEAESAAADNKGTATTEQAAAQTQAAIQQVKDGPVPLQVHQTALTNARTKAVQERDAQWMEKYGWATKVPEQSVKGALEMLQNVSTDPIGHVRRFVEATLGTPLGPALKAELARLIGNGNGNGHAPANYDPDVEIVGPDGRPQGKTFSAERVEALIQRVRDETRSEFEQVLNPIQQAHQQQQQRERDQQTAETARVEGERRNKRIDAALDRAVKILDGRNELLAEVSKLIPDNQFASLEDALDAMADAALTVRQQKISPNVEQNAAAKAAETMRQKAAANTANGRSSASAPQSKPTTRKELAQLLERLDAKSA